MANRLKRSGIKRVRGVRDPLGTREAILKAAREVLARDGKEGLSVAQVAQRAGVNRGTAYQHFKTREELIEATAVWVSEALYHATFGDPEVAPDQSIMHISVDGLTHHLANFAMENPELGRIWLFELLSSRRPASDAFWRQYETNLALFATTENAQPGIDTEVASVIMLAGCFLWPVWARSHARTAKERQQMAARFAREVIRMCMHGTLRPEKYPDIDAKLQKARSGKKGT
ncbi:MAG: TetR/AcrR family transcriptional regulator [Steroidobacteraceae bacterium]